RFCPRCRAVPARSWPLRRPMSALVFLSYKNSRANVELIFGKEEVRRRSDGGAKVEMAMPPWPPELLSQFLACLFIGDVKLRHKLVAAARVRMPIAGLAAIEFGEIAAPVSLDTEHFTPWFLPVGRRDGQKALEGAFQHETATVPL